MDFDLLRTLLAKEEGESARLRDFEFRLRARTLRLLVPRIGRDRDQLMLLIVEGDDDAVIERLRAELPGRNIAGFFVASRHCACQQLMGKAGDLAPHRLAYANNNLDRWLSYCRSVSRVIRARTDLA